MTEKRTVQVRGKSIYFDDLEGSIDEAIKTFQDLKTNGYEHFEECENFTGEIIGLIPYFHREETDAEFQERIRVEEIREAKAKKRRRQEYEFLRKEFGGEIK